jgi:spermidine synthase/ubiquinone/menaquinone biosynthesis C-methylase UbiE
MRCHQQVHQDQGSNPHGEYQAEKPAEINKHPPAEVINQSIHLLQVGCGNSKLSVDMYDVGYTTLTNIDISEVVIEQMKKQYRDRESCKWLVQDATAMEFPDGSFSVVLDKGTLDAMMSEESDSVHEMVRNYFKEVSRVLKPMGRFVCVSLLQEHIVKSLLEFFPANDFLFRVVRCLEAEEKTKENNEDGSFMPVFMIVATKFTKLPSKIFEVSQDGEAIERLQDDAALSSSVLTTQRAAMVRNGLIRKSNFDDEITFDLFRSNEKTPRFSLFILDQKAPAKGEYAAFICSQGRENEWLFSTKAGRRKLLESAKFSRLAIVTLHHDQIYESLDTIKKELNETVKSFAPKGLRDMSKVPFLSLGSDVVGTWENIYEGKSEMSGGFVVKDVTRDDKKTFRRLIFLNNQSVIQSEALMKQVKKKKFVDSSFLSCQHHTFMILGLHAVQTPKNLRNLVIGLGGGGLVNWIFNYLKEAATTAVEIDPEIVKVSKDFFGLTEDGKRLEVVVDDGLNYLKTSGKQFQSILFDVDSKDQSLGISCPPKEFLEPEILEAVKASLPKDGIFILNFVCRDESNRQQTLKTLKSIFSTVFSFKLDEDVNEIFYCFKDQPKNFQERFSKSGKQLNVIKKEMFDLEDLMEKLVLN